MEEKAKSKLILSISNKTKKHLLSATLKGGVLDILISFLMVTLAGSKSKKFYLTNCSFIFETILSKGIVLITSS